MTRLALLAALIPCAALAQDGIDAHGFDHVVSDGDVNDFLQTWRAERQVPGSIGLALLGEYAESPLVLVRRNGTTETREPLLDDVLALNFGAHVAVHERVAVGVGVPLYLSTTGRNGTEGPTLGDVHLSVPFGIVLPDEDGQGFGLSAVPFGWFPTGNSDRFLGGEAAAGLLVAPSFGVGDFVFTGNAGIEVNRLSSFLNLERAPRIIAAAGVSYAVTDTVGIGVEADYRGAAAKSEFLGTNSPSEALLHVGGRAPVGLTWRVGGAAGLSRGESTALFRVFAGLGWTFGKEGDIDGDGMIVDDQCPREPETFNDYKDDDGCPDGLANLTVTVVDPEGTVLDGAVISRDGQQLGVTDANGLFTLTDLMPGDTTSLRVEHGSGFYVPAERESAALEEGDNGLRVNLLWAPGTIRVKTLTTAGTPVDASLRFDGPETWDDVLVGDDGEEMMVLPPGDWTIFAIAPAYGRERREVSLSPSENVLTVIEFELAEARTMITESGVVILEPVLFEFDSEQLQPGSRDILESVANDLRTTPELRLVEVQGHTSTEGSVSYNRGLSQRRMDAVVSYLEQAGVEPGRLLPVGYGESCTAVVERNEADREKNRRVQFYILDPEPSGGVPCHAGVPGQLDEARYEFEREVQAPAEE